MKTATPPSQSHGPATANGATCRVRGRRMPTVARSQQATGTASALRRAGPTATGARSPRPSRQPRRAAQHFRHGAARPLPGRTYRSPATRPCRCRCRSRQARPTRRSRRTSRTRSGLQGGSRGRARTRLRRSSSKWCSARRPRRGNEAGRRYLLSIYLPVIH
ncbi:hypothetical protein BT67DRAFT_296599 [Trichocladium antarcticum]|uniref:Uncharacterized protein n=1 Tax=Trichocladium antarcticum TaxID=1450529 RepID=A0AAN6UKY9_9PEZI|nr:hypothetical protein BT67DRAFT_296599 [Trichocladium antarcticum]